MKPATNPLLCRACLHRSPKLILSLGHTPLANSLLTEEQLRQPEPTYPLDLAFCERCSLVQITETVAPEKLFREYLYFSSYSDTLLRHAEKNALCMINDRSLTQKSLVIEIASNDGYLLQHYKKQGIPVLGIEPAVNVAKIAERQRGIPTLTEFFGRDLARDLKRRGAADVIHANNVLAHVADLNGFVAGIDMLLKDDGIAVIEVPYVKDLVDRIEFDTIYHEHLCYFSLSALDRLFGVHNLLIADVEHLSIHGGSLRLFLGKKVQPSPRVRSLLEQEIKWGVDRYSFYDNFGSKISALRKQLRTMLNELKQDGKSIAGYGASAKGSTLLNSSGIGRETLDFVVDRSEVKQGLYTPGTHLPIYSPSRLLQEVPDYLLLLTWNFAEEILAQQAEFRRRNGRFIIPIPEPRIA